MERESEIIIPKSNFRLFEIELFLDGSEIVNKILSNFRLYRISISDEIDELFNLKNARWILGENNDLVIYESNCANFKSKTIDLKKLTFEVGEIDIYGENNDLVIGQRFTLKGSGNKLYLYCPILNTSFVVKNDKNDIRNIIYRIKLLPKTRIIYSESFFTKYGIKYEYKIIILKVRFYYGKNKLYICDIPAKLSEYNFIESKINEIIERVKNIKFYSICLYGRCEEILDEHCNMHPGYHPRSSNSVLIIENKFRAGFLNFTEVLNAYLNGNDISQLPCVEIISKGKSSHTKL